MKSYRHNTAFSLILLFFLMAGQTLPAQPAQKYVNIVVTPDHDDWNYKTGEKVIFNVQVLKHGNPVKGIEIKYKVGPENMDAVLSGELALKDGTGKIKGGTMKNPGFLRCHVEVMVDNHNYSNFATAAFDPESIKPTAILPDDFHEFWRQNLEDLKKVPVEAKVTLMPERCTEKVNVYHVNIANISGRVYGILCLPKAEGKHPALLQVPGAGARPYYGLTDMAAKGFITLQIGIHGVPVDMAREVYRNMMDGPIYRYWESNMDDKDRYYYKRVYLACVRAVDYIFTLPEFDSKNIAVFGGSQGGALSIVTASLDPRIKYLASYYPALCDLTGYLHGRTGGWPHLFKDEFTNTKKKIETSGYYDVVNFARDIHVPGIYCWGYNDNTCPPTSIFVAYNQISAPKNMLISHDSRHWVYPEFREKVNEWLLGQFEDR